MGSLTLRCAVLVPLCLLAVAVLSVVVAAPARADGFLVPTQPGQPVRGRWAVRHHRVDVRVQGPHAQITVDEEFVNLGDSTLEAEYVFPLPAGAMVSSVTLYEDGRGLEGRLFRAEEARRIYEEIVRRQRDPALLEYLGRDLFRIRVFPIPAGQGRRVVLKYDQLLEPDGNTFELAYPLNTEKFSARPLEEVVVSVEIDAGAPLGPVYSPSHEIEVVRTDAHKASVSYEAAGVTPDRDFVLFWATTRSPVGGTLLTYWPQEDERGYYLFLASPTVQGGEAARAKPKEITLVVDTSGSMAGDKIEQVRSALRQVLGGLNPGDRFNVIAYHTAVVPLWPRVREVTDQARRDAMAFVDGLRAQGGTNIKEALTFALAGTGAGDLSSALVFLTDGRPTVGETDTDKILGAVRAANPEGETRVFVFGVGVDVNTVLLDRLALDNHGAPAFVRPAEDVEPKVASLYDKIRYPVLTDLVFSAPGVDASEPLPTVLPDLFRGGQVVLAGRYRKGGRSEIVLSGQDGSVTREYHYLLRAAERGAGLQSNFPARVWATRRIGELIDQIRLRGKPEKEIVDEVVRLSTRFGILTEYTAFLAAEGADHTRFGDNTLEALRNVDHLARREVGGAGWAQSANQAGRRGADQPAPAQVLFFGDKDDRDVREVHLSGVRQVGNRTFYGRTRGWVDVNVAADAEVDETVERWSPRFFEILRATTAEENARLSQAGDLVLEIQGRVLHVVDRQG